MFMDMELQREAQLSLILQKLDHNKIKFIMDKNKLKNGLFTPGTKIKIIKFHKNKLPKKSKNLIILAWNFTKKLLTNLIKDLSINS